MTTEANAQPGTVTEAAVNADAAVKEPAVSASAPAADAKAADAGNAAADAGTLVAGAATAQDKPVAAPADWPTDWREKIANGDAKELEQLKRQNSPIDVWKKARSLEQKLSSGEYKRDLPKDATPEQKAEWRKERGFPEGADGYLENLSLPEGIVLGDADKPIAAAFAEAAFDGDVTPEQYSKLVAKYYAMQDQIQQQRAEADHQVKVKAEDELRAEWGPEYRTNLTAVSNLLAGLPEGAADNLLMGRLADGTRIGDSPGVVKWLAKMATELNPVASLMPSGISSGQGVSDRLGEIRKFRQENPDKYDADKKMQAEEVELLEAQSKLKSRGIAA